MFSVTISIFALADISAICEHIEKRFDNPIAANSFYEEARLKILSLNEFPERFPKVAIDGKYLHRMPVKNFYVYYRVNKISQTVTIARVLYSGMDINQVAFIN